jgi:FdhD protein
VLRLGGADPVERPDTLVVEEPLEIRVGGRPLAVTMRTPGADMDLAAGFLVSEGVVTETGQVLAQRYCAGAGDDGANTYNVLDVELDPSVPPPDPSVERAFYTSSSCGLCGKASLDAVRSTARWPVADDPVRVAADLLVSLPERLQQAQPVFDRTGGLHAAGLFTADGTLLCLREDVGRHNAVDKVVGWALREDLLPLRGTVLLVSGRASFELVQKAWMAGVPVLAAVSAPSSLAVDLAVEAGMTLVGFLRDPRMNVYSRPERVTG